MPSNNDGLLDILSTFKGREVSGYMLLVIHVTNKIICFLAVVFLLIVSLKS